MLRAIVKKPSVRQTDRKLRTMWNSSFSHRDVQHIVFVGLRKIFRPEATGARDLAQSRFGSNGYRERLWAEIIVIVRRVRSDSNNVAEIVSLPGNVSLKRQCNEERCENKKSAIKHEICSGCCRWRWRNGWIGVPRYSPFIYPILYKYTPLSLFNPIARGEIYVRYRRSISRKRIDNT